MRITHLLAAVGAAALIAGAANAETPAERESGIALDAYVGATKSDIQNGDFENMMLVRDSSTDFSSPNFGAGAMYRHPVGENFVVGAGVFLEGYSGDETTRDEEIVLNQDDVDESEGEVEEITVHEVDKTSLGVAYGGKVMAGYAFDDMPVLIYATAGYGWVAVEKSLSVGTTTGVFDTSLAFTEVAAGAEYDFAPGAAVFVEVAHREFEDKSLRYDTGGHYGEFGGDSQQARFGVRFHF